MMKKLDRAGKGGGSSLPPFTLFAITYKVAVYSPAERADTLTLFHLYLPNSIYLSCIILHFLITPFTHSGSRHEEKE